MYEFSYLSQLLCSLCEQKSSQQNGALMSSGAKALTLVQRVVRVGFQEEVLQTDHDRVQVEHGFPVLAQDVEAHVSLEVDIRVVNLTRFHVRNGSGVGE